MFEKLGTLRLDRNTLYDGECWSVRYFHDTTIEILNLYFFCIKVREIKNFKGKACKSKE